MFKSLIAWLEVVNIFYDNLKKVRNWCHMHNEQHLGEKKRNLFFFHFKVLLNRIYLIITD
jgi:hypothetical protein